MIGRNPNKDYNKAIQFTGGSINGYNPSQNPNLTAYKTGNGTRGVQFQGSTWYDDGNGRFVKSTGRDYLTYDNAPAAPAPAPPSSGGGGGGGGSSSSGSYPRYPVAGNTGYPSVDANSLAMMEMIKALTESISTLGEIKESDIEDVSKGAGEGLSSTILTGSSYIPSAEKKKKSYLTPITVG